MLEQFFIEVVRAMTYIIQEGYSMYWGTSRWSQIEVNKINSANEMRNTYEITTLICKIDYGSVLKLSPIQLYSANCRASRVSYVLS